MSKRNKLSLKDHKTSANQKKSYTFQENPQLVVEKLNLKNFETLK